MTSFSLLPLELREEIASYIPYKEIMSLCHVEKAFVDIPTDKNFWRSLIVTHFPDFANNPKTLDDPKYLFSYLEQHAYRITLTPPDKKPLCFTSDDKYIIAVTILIALKIFSETSQVSLVDQLKIIQPNGELLTHKRAILIVKEYTSGFWNRRSLKVIMFSSESVYGSGQFTRFPRIHTPYTSPYITKHVLKLLEYLNAKEITTANLL